MANIKLKYEPSLKAKLNAFRYQSEAFEQIKSFEYAAIFHEQGLGKTKIAIDLGLYWIEQKVVDTVIIVAKKGLIKNWQDELKMHSHITPLTFTQDSKNNFYAFNTPRRLILAHYEVLKKEEERFKLYFNSRKIGIILDESTKIKNPSSTLARAVINLAPLCKRRVIISGTPIANRPYDIWNQINFLDSGEHLGFSYDDFKSSLDMSTNLTKTKNRKHFESFLSWVWPKISNFSVRETKDSCQIDLPDKQFKTIFSDWESRQRDIYNEVREELKTIVIKDGIPTEDNSEGILKRLIRLVQIASNPSLITDAYSFTPGKFQDLNDIVNNIVGQGEKCIIWTSFTDNADYIHKEYKKYGAVKVHGKLSYDARNKSIDDFKNNKDTKILIATPGAAKEGLTLTSANHAIFYDRTFSLDDYLQAQDRIHRISQTKKCFVYNLLMKDSIDQWVDLLLQAKHMAAKLGVGDIDFKTFSKEFSYEFIDMLKDILKIEKSEKI
jgi:SNF2 family DNA or RNA helicase